MQGYCQVSRFNIPPDGLGVHATPLTPGTVEHPDVEVDYIIISRRSRHRPGLRYQRRGIDDAAHVANFVETESIVSVEVSLLSHYLFGDKSDKSEREKEERTYFRMFRSEVLVSLPLYRGKLLFIFDNVTVPLFWTQTGYGLKPPPVLSADRTKEQNEEAMRKHLATLVVAYGPLVRFESTGVR